MDSLQTCRPVLPLAIAVAMLAGAPSWASPARQESAMQSETSMPEWPGAPAAARIRFQRSVESASDWGIKRSWLGRLADSLTGRHEKSFVRPTGVAANAGVLYIADPGAQAMIILDPAGRREIRLTRAGDRPLVSPVAVAPGPDGGVFLADSGLRQVLQFTRDGTFKGVVAIEGLQRPAAVAWDASRQRLYVADSLAHSIKVLDAQGRAIRTIGRRGDADGEFNSPTHLALDAQGVLHVTDALNFRVQAFDEEGRWVQRLGEAGDGAGNFAAPKGVAVDPAGHVYVADAMFDAVQAFDAKGRLLIGFGRQGNTEGEFWMPNGLYIDRQARLYVADAYNRRIQVFQLLGMPGDPGSPDGGRAW